MTELTERLERRIFGSSRLLEQVSAKGQAGREDLSSKTSPEFGHATAMGSPCLYTQRHRKSFSSPKNHAIANQSGCAEACRWFRYENGLTGGLLLGVEVTARREKSY